MVVMSMSMFVFIVVLGAVGLTAIILGVELLNRKRKEKQLIKEGVK